MRVNYGFTLLELMVTLAILSIVLGVGVPSMLEMARNARLQGAGQESYALLQFARSDALRANADRFVVWSTAGGNWCAVVSERNDCDCLSEDCSIDGVLRQQSSADFANVSLASAAFSAGSFTRFDGMRGLAEGHAGSVSYQLPASDDSTVADEIRLVVSGLGRVRLCQVGGVGSYPAC
jgi:type IV fimbrial biogenesis protein FimT